MFVVIGVALTIVFVDDQVPTEVIVVVAVAVVTPFTFTLVLGAVITILGAVTFLTQTDLTTFTSHKPELDFKV